MATQNGTMVLQGVSGRIYTVDLYLPDAVSTKLTFNPAGLAASTSNNNYRVPENCNLVDISVGAAPTAVGAALTVNSGVINGGSIRWANQLSSLANRLKMKIPLRQGDFIEFNQF